ncbi:unnamed protein product, partial [Ectocarpus sp. 13 AM-2016]
VIRFKTPHHDQVGVEGPPVAASSCRVVVLVLSRCGIKYQISSLTRCFGTIECHRHDRVAVHSGVFVRLLEEAWRKGSSEFVGSGVAFLNPYLSDETIQRSRRCIANPPDKEHGLSLPRCRLQLLADRNQCSGRGELNPASFKRVIDEKNSPTMASLRCMCRKMFALSLLPVHPNSNTCTCLKVH